jgi:(E)-4-hydroxy-3-methylbut-2-enyl-diphosphate synthase
MFSVAQERSDVELMIPAERRRTKQIMVGNVPIGGDAPIAVQSMTTTDTRDVMATVQQIRDLEAAGCDIVRVAVPDREAARALKGIKEMISIPLIADIHFDYRLALMAIEAGVDGLRLNPGNIRKPDQVRAVVTAAKERRIPIRIGVNAGSLPPAGTDSTGRPQEDDIPGRMVDAALRHIRILEDLGFDLIKVSLKAFDVPTMVEAYRRMATLVDYPFHLGVTEAGTPFSGSIRSAVGIGILLAQGIGDTIRISLTGDPVQEVEAAYEILKALNLRRRGPTMISCPSCGRVEIDLINLANKVEARLKALGRPLTVAVMGCVVNGPGEARMADVGIAGGKGKGVIFRKGEVVKVCREEELEEALMAEIDSLLRDGEPAPIKTLPVVNMR